MARLRQFLIIIFINATVLELLSFSLVYGIGFIRPDFRLDLTIEDLFKNISEEDLRIARKGHDGLLGWDRNPLDSRTEINSAGKPWTISWGADGARRDPRNRGRVAIAAYGDSFTEGAEVGNDQTWEYFLEELLGYEVKNYGVSGFGTGQAYLKLQRHFANGVIAPMTMLVIYVDDLGRTVNNFRLFLNRYTDGKLAFKPSYRYLDGEIRFFSNPYNDTSMTLDDLKSLALRSAKLDYWMSRWLYLDLEFPYSLQVAKAVPVIYRKFIQKVRGEQENDSIWKDQEGRFVLQHILNEFSLTAMQHGTVPIVVFLPDVAKWNNGRVEPEYARFKKDFLADGRRDVLVIDLYDAEFDESRFLINGFSGHPSSYGNQVIARHIWKRLKESGLLHTLD